MSNRLEKQILPSLGKITETELLKALLAPQSMKRFPNLHKLVKNEDDGLEAAYKQVASNVRDALQYVKRHHHGKWAKMLSKGLSSKHRRELLGLTPSQVKSSQKKLSEKEVENFKENYASGVVRQCITDLEIAGWLHTAEKCLEQKSGDTDKVVYYIREDRFQWFWTKLVPRSWEVYKYCWEQEPLFNCYPKGRKETVFERNMRVWKERSKYGRETPPVTPPAGAPDFDEVLNGDDDCEVPEELRRYVGFDTILCRTPAAVFKLLKRNRGKKTG